jgi:hypothetical protein
MWSRNKRAITCHISEKLNNPPQWAETWPAPNKTYARRSRHETTKRGTTESHGTFHHKNHLAKRYRNAIRSASFRRKNTNKFCTGRTASWIGRPSDWIGIGHGSAKDIWRVECLGVDYWLGFGIESVSAELDGGERFEWLSELNDKKL